jgi:hypothetical protein
MANGGSTDISTSVHWTLSAASAPGTSIDTTGFVTTSSTDIGTVNITATDQSTGIVSNTAVLTLTAP